MKFQLLPSSFNDDGSASQRQHLACVVVNDRIAIDAGSLAMGCREIHREMVRDVVLSHTHLDHIAGLPSFVDDLFSQLAEPVNVHGTSAMLAALRQHIFNDVVYPDFSAFQNDRGPVLSFNEFEFNRTFTAAGVKMTPVKVNHNDPSAAFLLTDDSGTLIITGDTAETSEIWQRAAETDNVMAMLVECSFPDRLSGLASAACHLTPEKLAGEIGKIGRRDFPVYVVNIKPMYRDEVVDEIDRLRLDNVDILTVGREYTV